MKYPVDKSQENKEEAKPKKLILNGNFAKVY